MRADHPSREDQTFDGLVAQLEELRSRLAEWRTFEERYTQQVMGKLVPLEERLRDARRALILQCEAILAGRRGGGVSGKAERRELVAFLIDLCGVHLGERPDDAAIRAVHDGHAAVRFDDREVWAVRGAEEAAAQEADEIEGGLPQPSVAEPWLAAAAAAEEAERRAQDAREAARRQRQHERVGRREAERAAAAAQVARAPSPSVREVYRRLASALHPDRARDAGDRTRRNELMQRANAACDDRDLLALLTLQLEIEQIDARHLATRPPAELQRYSAVLREQVTDLERELRGIAAHYGALLADPSGRMTPRAAERGLRRWIAEVRHEVERLRALALELLDPEFRRAWLKDGMRQSR